MITHNQVLKHLFLRKDLSRLETRCIGIFGQLEINVIMLKLERVHVLRYVMSHLPHRQKSSTLSNMQASGQNVLKTFSQNYKENPIFSSAPTRLHSRGNNLRKNQKTKL